MRACACLFSATPPPELVVPPMSLSRWCQFANCRSVLGTGARAYNDSSAQPNSASKLFSYGWEDVHDPDGIRVRRRTAQHIQGHEHQDRFTSEKPQKEEAHAALPSNLAEAERLKMLLEHVCASEKKRISQASENVGASLLTSLDDFPIEIEKHVANNRIRVAHASSNAGQNALSNEKTKKFLETLVSHRQRELEEWRAGQLNEHAIYYSPAETAPAALQVPTSLTKQNEYSGYEQHGMRWSTAQHDACLERNALAREIEQANARRELQAEALASAAQKAEAVHKEAERVCSRVSSTLRSCDFANLPASHLSPGSLAQGFLQHDRTDSDGDRRKS